MSSWESYSAKAKTENTIRRNAQKIDRINRNIHTLGQKWVAGETSVSELSYQEKKSLFGGRVPNLQGYEYYLGGYIELPESSLQEYSTGESLYPSEFSWKNKHGIDWTTGIKSQEGCGSCWAFGPTAAVELLVNIYFNRKLDYDLSEQNLIACTEGKISCGTHKNALEYITETGIVPEDCFPYEASEMLCEDICSDPSDQVKITGWSDYRKVDEIKSEIINGTAAASIRYWGHIVSIVGYRVIADHDSLFIRNTGAKSWIYIEPGNDLVGKTAWLMKNSWGQNWGDEGYAYIIENSFHIEMHSLDGEIISRKYNTEDIRCVDNDGDGYYYWGIGEKPSHCPYCPPDPDGDDSNPNIGPVDQFGKSTLITKGIESKLLSSPIEIDLDPMQKNLIIRSRGTEPTTICITNLVGKMLYGFSMTGSYHRINLTNLNADICIIAVNSGNTLVYKNLLLL